MCPMIKKVCSLLSLGFVDLSCLSHSLHCFYFLCCLFCWTDVSLPLAVMWPYPHLLKRCFIKISRVSFRLRPTAYLNACKWKSASSVESQPLLFFWCCPGLNLITILSPPVLLSFFFVQWTTCSTWRAPVLWREGALTRSLWCTVCICTEET